MKYWQTQKLGQKKKPKTIKIIWSEVYGGLLVCGYGYVICWYGGRYCKCDFFGKNHK
jgi:hypothetical protein